jgi:hypothetical protein
MDNRQAIREGVERRELMEAGEYYHLWFLSTNLPSSVFLERAHEELVLVLSDQHQLRVLASTKLLGIWTLQLNGNHEYGLSDHNEIPKTRVSLAEFPLYISWIYKSEQFYKLLKGND